MCLKFIIKFIIEVIIKGQVAVVFIKYVNHHQINRRKAQSFSLIIDNLITR